MIRVAFVDHTAKLSGAELALLHLVPYFQSIDPVFILGENGPLVDELKSVGAEVHVSAGIPRWLDALTSGSPTLRSAVQAPSAVVRTSRLLRRLDVDFVHLNTLRSLGYGTVAAKTARKPVVWHGRDILDDAVSNRFLRTGLRKTGDRAAAGLVSNSCATRNSFALTVAHNEVIPSPITEAVFSVPPMHVRSDGKLRILMLGRLAPWKGQHVLMQALQALDPHVLAGLEVDVVGGPLFGEHAYEAELHQLAAGLTSPTAVRFHGHQRDIIPYVEASHIFVHCSTSAEPFGQVVAQGMASGRAVIATNAGGPAEMIRSGVTGFLVSPSRSDELAKALTVLAQDHDRVLSLGLAARAASNSYHVSRVCRELELFYATLGAAA